MPTIIYLANEFPSPVEPYVLDEIQALRRNGATVIPYSSKRPRGDLNAELEAVEDETRYLWPMGMADVAGTTWLFIRQLPKLADLIWRLGLRGRESLGRRLRAVLHTWLGVYLASRLKERRVDHIHVHHGYFSSWVGMVAARLVNASFSFTLHGSDLLLHPHFLDEKLKNCDQCFTISDFNRQEVVKRYPAIAPEKVKVCRLGVDPVGTEEPSRPMPHFTLLTAGRLHAIKDHAFLLRACAELKRRGLDFRCLIAGDGPERKALEEGVKNFGLQGEVRFLGHLSKMQLDICYRNSDLVVLTSRSEGIPVVLMEAMARGTLVLAPTITGIPELIHDGETGFLYKPGSLGSFVGRVIYIHDSLQEFDGVRSAARSHAIEHFNRGENLARYCDLLLQEVGQRAGREVETSTHADTLLQQI